MNRRYLSRSITLKDNFECTRAIRSTHFLTDCKTFLGLTVHIQTKRYVKSVQSTASVTKIQTKGAGKKKRSKISTNRAPGLNILSPNWLVVK